MYIGFDYKIKSYEAELIIEMVSSKQLRAIESEMKQKLGTGLKLYLEKGKAIDASIVSEEWFPDVNADIFISHSHKDKDLALAIASLIREKLGIKCFVDGAVWGNVNELLKEIDEEYCRNRDAEGKKLSTYDYDSRNKSTAHVYMILGLALAKMMDRCECLFFLNTPDSINAESSVRMDVTKSPWLYYEIGLSSLIQKPLELHNNRSYLEKAETKVFNEAVDIDFPIDTDHLHDLNYKGFFRWMNKCALMDRRPQKHLEVLYKSLLKS